MNYFKTLVPESGPWNTTALNILITQQAHGKWIPFEYDFRYTFEPFIL